MQLQILSWCPQFDAWSVGEGTCSQSRELEHKQTSSEPDELLLVLRRGFQPFWSGSQVAKAVLAEGQIIQPPTVKFQPHPNGSANCKVSADCDWLSTPHQQKLDHTKNLSILKDPKVHAKKEPCSESPGSVIHILLSSDQGLWVTALQRPHKPGLQTFLTVFLTSAQ